jgi:diaminopimelate epimerase
MLRLTKHHALGNDFLVLLDLDGIRPLEAGQARALCDRHTGIGADGVIRATRGAGGADITMELRNADGGRAETSGNGLACLAQAAVQAGAATGPDMIIKTDAGLRTVRVGDDGVHVWMGHACALEGVWPEVDGARKIAGVDLGNPHVVVLVRDPDREDFSARAVTANWEAIVEGPEAGSITMRVWERGVGETEACGTGACAAAHSANEWGLVDTRVVVHQRGGDAVVELGDDIIYTVEPHHIATIETAPTWH